jgi:hypothetical protein
MSIIKNLLFNGVENTIRGYTEQVEDTAGPYEDAIACQEALRQNGIESGVVMGTRSGVVVVRPEDKSEADRLMRGGMKH